MNPMDRLRASRPASVPMEADREALFDRIVATPTRAAGARPARRRRKLVLVAAVGLAVTLTAGTAVYGAMIGSFAYMACLVLGATCGGWIGRIRISQRVVRSVLYFVGGVLGWLLATLAGNAFGLVHVPMTADSLRLTVPARKAPL